MVLENAWPFSNSPPNQYVYSLYACHGCCSCANDEGRRNIVLTIVANKALVPFTSLFFRPRSRALKRSLSDGRQARNARGYSSGWRSLAAALLNRGVIFVPRHQEGNWYANKSDRGCASNVQEILGNI